MPSFSEDANAIHPYLTDESSAFTGHADRVYFPADASEVAEILREASRAGIGVTISGGGTSLTGARVPMSGGWILATDRFRIAAAPQDSPATSWQRMTIGDAVMYLDADRRRAVVPPGLRLSELNTALSPLGLFYPPTLTETSAMAGGTIATNASGARSFHYGSTRAWVDSLTVVTPRGELLRIRRGEHTAHRGRLALTDEGPVIDLPDLPSLGPVKNAAGFHVEPGMDAIDLFIGGEGTLGVIVEAELRLESRAADAVTLLVFHEERDAALDLADAVRQGLFDPWTALALEYFDANALDFMRDAYADVPGAAAGVLIELAPPAADDEWYDNVTVADDWRSRTARFNPKDTWVVLPTESEDIRLFRHSLPDRVNDYVRTRRGKLGTDFAVPAASFRDLMSEYDKAAAAGVRTVLFGHLGEYHLHLNFLAADDAEMSLARRLYTTLARKAVSLGGTVSAEHGVGKKRIWLETGETVPYLQLMFGEAGLQEMSKLKRQLDPGWILNRGTMMPPEGAP